MVKAEKDEQRLELARGTISAFITAPPRLFFVETPAATAIGIGCAYVLHVPLGAGRPWEQVPELIASRPRWRTRWN